MCVCLRDELLLHFFLRHVFFCVAAVAKLHLSLVCPHDWGLYLKSTFWLLCASFCLQASSHSCVSLCIRWQTCEWKCAGKPCAGVCVCVGVAGWRAWGQKGRRAASHVRSTGAVSPCCLMRLEWPNLTRFSRQQNIMERPFDLPRLRLQISPHTLPSTPRPRHFSFLFFFPH